jgi:hypothetical protein
MISYQLNIWTPAGHQFDHVFDWTLLKCKQTQKVKAQQQDPGVSSRQTPMNMDKHQVSGSRAAEASGQLEAEQRPAIRMQIRATAENSRSNNRHSDKLVMRLLMMKISNFNTSSDPK